MTTRPAGIGHLIVLGKGELAVTEILTAPDLEPCAQLVPLRFAGRTRTPAVPQEA
jgi:hypothetical protein